jgi:hypothetical protein
MHIGVRILIIGPITVIAACSAGDRQEEVRTGTTRSRDSAVSTTAIRSRDSSVNAAVPKDSVGLSAYEDSIIGQLPIGSPGIVTANGDTLRSLGYGFLQDSSAKDYSFLYYSRNDVPYIRVVRRSSEALRGPPTRSTTSRLRLPAIDSTQHLVMEGYCVLDGKDAPLIIAITGTAGDSAYWHARHAWKLDTGAGILRKIPIAGVMCSHVSGEE